MPKFSVIAIISLLFITGCKEDTSGTVDNSESTDVTELQNRIKQLELTNTLKDSVINESLLFFNEIQENLETIGIRKDEIRVLSNNSEITNTDKQWILEQIRQINFLREDNARKVKRLNEQMSTNGLKIEELEIMIESLLKDIQWKDEQIKLLESELNDLDAEYSKLFSAYQDAEITIESLTMDMNTVYYAYGSAKELRDNGVVEKRNGFIGIGKKIRLKDEFNDEYFTKIDANKNKEVIIEGVGVHFVTIHPTASYTLSEEGPRTRIKITDVSEFWKVSKYLVVTVQ
ncbi:MAG: chromosome segregation ATPase [Flavobacteriaceae bacterium]|jgi:chromosome segregation ATPase